MLNYTRTTADYSVFYDAKGIIIAVYVDNLLIFGARLGYVRNLEEQLKTAFDMTDLEPCSFYPGIEVTRDRNTRTLILCEGTYIRKILEAFRMANCSTAVTPMEPGARYLQNGNQATEADIRDINQH